MPYDISCLSVLYDINDNNEIKDNSFNRQCISNGLSNNLLMYDGSCNDTICHEITASGDIYDNSNN